MTLTANVSPHRRLPGHAAEVMHAELRLDGRPFLLAWDTPLAITGCRDAEIRGYWDRLAEGAEIVMPLETAPLDVQHRRLTTPSSVPVRHRELDGVEHPEAEQRLAEGELIDPQASESDVEAGGRSLP